MSAYREHPNWKGEGADGWQTTDGRGFITQGSTERGRRWLLWVTGYRRPVAAHADTPEFLMHFYDQTMKEKT